MAFDIRSAFSGFMTGLRNGPVIPKPNIPVTPEAGLVQVIDSAKPPTTRQIPGSWSRSFLGPGQPFGGIDTDTLRGKDKELEPRAFQYVSSINSTITPRIGYGLTSFSDLRYYAETVPEVSMCLRLLTEEMKSFVPTIVDKDDHPIDDSEYDWMTKNPDQFNPFPVWLSRFLYNVLVYDAGCAYWVRNSKRKIRASRIIDGSTIFVIINEKGEQPSPPAPAFQQIIWGVPRLMMNTRQLWYHPRHLRADAPYGRSPIEDSWPAVQLLYKLWDYEAQKYIVGNIPEQLVTAPEGWKSADDILEYEEAFNARMSGSNEERARLRFIPAGCTSIATKEMSFNKESYDAATNAVRMSFGIVQSEVGEGPNAGLGGKGYAEAMQSAFYRMGLAPLISYVESHFNDIIKANGDSDKAEFKLKFPPESLDPQKEEAKHATRFEIGGISRDEYRQGIGLNPLHGDAGNYFKENTKAQELDANGNPVQSKAAMKKPVLVRDGNRIAVKRPVDVVKDPVKVMAKPVYVNKISHDEIIDLGDKMGVDWDTISADEFIAGVNEEMEHADTVDGDMETIAQIALDHLEEDDHYYSKLRDLFSKLDNGEFSKYCGVDPEDDILFGSPVHDFAEAEMPKQGANESYIVSIGDGDLQGRPAVWKPLSGEKPSLQTWVKGTLFRRSEAAYLLDRELSPDENHYLVPVTYITQVNGEMGSIQHYVTGRQPRREVAAYDDAFIERAAVLDYIMGQMDRDGKNWLTHPHHDNRPVLIDNDISFSPDKDAKIHSSFVEAMRGRPLSQKSLDAIYILLGNHELWDDLMDCLDDEAAVANAKARAQELYENGMIGGKNPERILVTKSNYTILEKGVGKSNGSMVAIDVPPEMAKKLFNSKINWPTGSEVLPETEYHITLAFFGDTPDLDYDKSQIWAAAESFVKGKKSFSGRINGVGRFLESHKEGMNCIYANFDSPKLPEFRKLLVDYLNQCECTVKENHGFTPHMTLAYIPKDSKTPDTSEVEVIEFEVKGITAYWNDESQFFPFTDEEQEVEKWEESKHHRYPKGDERGGEFAPKGEGDSGGEPKSENGEVKEVAQELKVVSVTNPEGYSWRPRDGAPSHGYMTSEEGFEEEITADKVEEKIPEYVKRTIGIIKDDPNTYYGGWFKSSTNTFILDISKNYSSMKEAWDAAKNHKKANGEPQDAIFDLNEMREIPVGKLDKPPAEFMHLYKLEKSDNRSERTLFSRPTADMSDEEAETFITSQIHEWVNEIKDREKADGSEAD